MDEANYKKSLLFSGEAFKDRLIPLLTAFVYLILSYFLVGIAPDKIFIAVLFLVLYFYSASTRKFILGFSIFIVYWIIYDYMKAFPNYNFNDVNIAGLYYFEKEYFGISYSGVKLTLNEFFVLKSSKFLDVVSAMFYLCWIPLPLFFAFYLFKRNRQQFLVFSLAFLFTNLIGFLIYYLYPAAPPWYIADYGFEFISSASGSAAGLLKFDRFAGFPLFESMYEKGSNVFAAVPSLHCSYPLLVIYYGWKFKCGKKISIFLFITLGIWFASVYLNHHYIVDVIAGIIVAVMGIILIGRLLKTNFSKRVIQRFQNVIQ